MNPQSNEICQNWFGTREKELDVLKWLADVMLLANENEQPEEEDDCTKGAKAKMGINFLLMSQRGDSGFLPLNNHFVPLSHPDITSRLRLARPSTSPSLAAAAAASSSTNTPLQSVRLLAAELVLGLLFLHENGIVHQDIKPANMMISPSGHAIITDFGAANPLPRLSRATSTLGSSSSDSRTYGPIVKRPDDAFTFTPPYAAPELYETTSGGFLEYDERVDFYGLAVVLYECATGSLPSDIIVSSERGANIASMVGENPDVSGGGDEGWDVQFEMFVKHLLVHNFQDRLCGSAVKNHLFFEPISEIWEDIASLNYPPLPNPPSSYGLSLSFDFEAVETSSLDGNADGLSPEIERQPSLREADTLKLGLGTDIVEEFAAESRECIDDGRTTPKSTRGHEALWLRRSMNTRPSLDGSECEGAVAQDGVVPDYIVRWMTGPNTQPSDGENGWATAAEDGHSVCLGDKVSGSEFVIPEDHRRSPRAFDRGLRKADKEPRPNSRNGSPSPSLSPPSSYSSTSSESEETDDELLLAVENYRRLEALLASGSYFAEIPPPLREDKVGSKPAMRNEPQPPPRVRLLSNVSAPFPHRNTAARAEVDIDISDLVSDSVWRRFLEGDQVATWTFEDEITMAVLDAMDQRPVSSSGINESEFGVMEEPRTLTVQRKRANRRQSIRKTFEMVKRTFRWTKNIMY